MSHAPKTGHTSIPPQYLRLFKPRSTRCVLTLKGTLWDVWTGAPAICLCLHKGVSRPKTALPSQLSCHLSLPNYQRYSKRWQQSAPALQPNTADPAQARFYSWALIYACCTTAYKHILPFTDDKPHKLSRSWQVPQHNTTADFSKVYMPLFCFHIRPHQQLPQLQHSSHSTITKMSRQISKSLYHSAWLYLRWWAKVGVIK